MSTIRRWAAEYGVPLNAVVALESRLGLAPAPLVEADNAHMMGSEARQQDLVRLEAAHKGVRLFRNNVGALPDNTGRMVRYGLANDSKQLNDVLKSSDLIGWRKLIVTPDMIGTPIAQFVAREMKEQGWIYGASEHERAQLAFIELVAADGGDASFATGPGTL